MTTRLRKVVKPRSNGDNRFGYVTDPPSTLIGLRSLRRASRWRSPRRGCRRAAPGTGAARRRSTRRGRETDASRIPGRCRAIQPARRAAPRPGRAARRRRRAAAPRILTARSRVRLSATELPRPDSGSAIQRASSARPASETVYTFLSGLPCWATGRDVHPAVVLHRAQRAVDLLMGGGPEVADGPVEPAGELVSGAGLLAQRHQDRVGEGHVRSVGRRDRICNLLHCTQAHMMPTLAPRC